MTFVSIMAEKPDIEEMEHYFFFITSAAPNRPLSELLSDLRVTQTAGVVQLEELNITLYFVPASESRFRQLSDIGDPKNALACFLTVTS